ncbi:MAG TPA: serine O-acetyltransferase, partial [Telluria sp.]|nr:serine O-acetyltransferase [Telluria sp.]
AGATAVGNPAHIIKKDVDGRSAQLFAAYGVTPNGDDPLSKALHGLINHAARQDEQIERLTALMKSSGIACSSMPECDKLNSVELNKLVE